MIELDGSQMGVNGNGLFISASDSTVRGLVINRFPGVASNSTANGNAIVVGGTGNVIEGNFIGTDTTGSIGLGSSTDAGIRVSGSTITIGGATPQARNVISGNATGIWFRSAADDVTVIGNYIGTNADGDAALATTRAIVFQSSGTNTIGGGLPEERNVISGHQVAVQFRTGSGHAITGNFFGTDATGTVPLPNVVGLQWDPTGNVQNVLVGTDGSPDTAGNLIVGDNSNVGIQLQGNTTGTVVAGNTVSRNRSGIIVGSSQNTIGGATSVERNLIIDNQDYGLRIDGDSNTVQGNFIGIDAAGLVAANGDEGVLILGANNTIGTDGDGSNDSKEGNAISGNNLQGVRIAGVAAIGNVVAGNFIGTDASGTQDRGNLSHGVLIEAGASSNHIGGTQPFERNVIGYNGGHGIAITSDGSDANIVQGNFIGTNLTRTLPMGNTGSGIVIGITAGDVSTNNWIGGTGTGAGNTIANNAEDGIRILAGSTGNTLRGNRIYENDLLGIDLGGDGVTLNDTGDPDSGTNGLQNLPVIDAAFFRGRDAALRETEQLAQQLVRTRFLRPAPRRIRAATARANVTWDRKMLSPIPTVTRPSSQLSRVPRSPGNSSRPPRPTRPVTPRSFLWPCWPR